MAGFIELADDLEAISTIDHEQEVAPGEVGLAQEDVEDIWQALKRLYSSRTQPGLVLCIRRQGKIFFKRSIGHASGNGPKQSEIAESVKLLTPDTPVCLFSTSKAVTAMLIHLLHDENHLDVYSRVVDYIPEFGQNGKQNVTIKDILSHQAGIQRFAKPIKDERIFDLEYLLSQLYKLPLRKDITGAPAYHASTGGYILGEIARRVTGQSLQRLLLERIKNPLKLTYFQYGADQGNIAKIAHNYVTGLPHVFPINLFVDNALGASFDEIVELAQQPQFYDRVMPSVNMVSTASEIGLFFELLRQGGEINGQRIFAADTIARATEETGQTILDRSIMMPMRYSAGFMLGNEPVGLYGANSKEAYGHLGFMNTLCWADPARETSVALLTTGKVLFSSHVVDYVNLIGTIAKRTLSS